MIFIIKRISLIGFVGFIGTAVIATLMLTGCQTPTPTGTIEAAQPPWLLHYSQYPPRISVKRPDGSEVRLNKVGGPFFIVGFISPPADDPGYISPALQKMANNLWLDSIDVIQITLPTESCSLSPEATASCTSPTKNLHRFFDPKKLAWRSFHEPASGTILLINRRNLIPIIDTRGTIKDPSWILHRAEQLQMNWEHEERETSGP